MTDITPDWNDPTSITWSRVLAAFKALDIPAYIYRRFVSLRIAEGKITIECAQKSAKWDDDFYPFEAFDIERIEIAIVPEVPAYLMEAAQVRTWEQVGVALDALGIDPASLSVLMRLHIADGEVIIDRMIQPFRSVEPNGGIVSWDQTVRRIGITLDPEVELSDMIANKGEKGPTLLITGLRMDG